MVVHEVFEVLYSPVKAFKKIIEKPDFKGPILVLALTMVAAVVAQYAFFSRIFFETGPNGYVSFLSKDVVSCRGGLRDNLIGTPIIFFIGWGTYFGAIWITAKLFGHETGSAKRLIIVVGHLFIVGAVYLFIIAALYSTIPELKLPQDAWNYWDPQVTREEMNYTYFNIVRPQMQETWIPTVTYPLLVVVSYLSFPFDIWTVTLAVVAVRPLYKLTWKKAAYISVVAYVIYVFLRLFLIGY